MVQGINGFNMDILTLEHFLSLVDRVGVHALIDALAQSIETCFVQWQHFDKQPRCCMKNQGGVFELMPTLGQDYYAFKYVNGHAHNTDHGMPSVMGLGMLCDAVTGQPLFLSEMTLLTAWRTAVVTALGSKYCAPSQSCKLGLVGCGAQSEFLALAHERLLQVDQLYYYDLDQVAMEKMAKNLEHVSNLVLVPCASIQEVVEQSEVVVTATTAHGGKPIVTQKMLKPGLHISAIGGDSAGKTELDAKILDQAKLVVEFVPQTKVEGEIQQNLHVPIHAELWELIAGHKTGRDSDEEMTLFDSVGFAIEDYAALVCVYELATKYELLEQKIMIPALTHPKDLYALHRS